MHTSVHNRCIAVHSMHTPLFIWWKVWKHIDSGWSLQRSVWNADKERVFKPWTVFASHNKEKLFGTLWYSQYKQRQNYSRHNEKWDLTCRGHILTWRIWVLFPNPVLKMENTRWFYQNTQFFLSQYLILLLTHGELKNACSQPSPCKPVYQVIHVRRFIYFYPDKSDSAAWRSDTTLNRAWL